MANMLSTIADLTLPEVRRAITQAPRSKKTRETRPDRAPRQYTLGPVLAEVCMRFLLWEGHEQSEEGVHKSFGEVSDEISFSVDQIKGARKEARGGGTAEGDAGVPAGP